MVRVFALVFFILTSVLCPAVNAAPVVAGKTQPSEYQWDTLTEGKAVYIDRNYAYTKVPSAYTGAMMLRTANDDKRATGDSFLSFDVNQPVTVWVAHDMRITDKPSWLSSWTATGENLLTSDATLELFRKDFPTGTVTLGGNGGPSVSSMYTLLVAAAGTMEEPEMPPQQASTAKGTPVTIKPWVDDPPASITIVSSPSHGQASVNDDGTITYKPAADFTGSDIVSYKLTANDGSIKLASLTITVTCAACNPNTMLQLTWDPNPVVDKVRGYRVYFGVTASDATTMVADLSVAGAGFDASAPAATFDASDKKIDAKAGQAVCFRVTAYNEAGMSDYSEAACSKL